MIEIRKNFVKLIVVTVILTGFLGCASSGNQSLKQEDKETVSQKIIEGETTKADIRRNFGDPVQTSFTDSGFEIWTFQLDNVSPDAVTFIPVVNWFGTSASGTRKELVVMFDKEDRVKRYSMSTSDVSHRSGVFR